MFSFSKPRLHTKNITAHVTNDLWMQHTLWSQEAFPELVIRLVQCLKSMPSPKVSVRHRHLPPCNQDTTYTVYTLIHRRYRLYNCPWDRSHHKKQRQARSNLLSFPLLTLVSQTKLQQVARNPDTKSDQPLGFLACPSWLSRICSVLWSSWSWQAPVLVSAWCLSETPQLHPPPSSLPRMPKEDAQ